MGSTSFKEGLRESLFDVIRLSDILVLVLAALIAYVLRHPHFPVPGNYTGFIILELFFYMALASSLGLYKMRCLHGMRRQILLLLVAHGTAISFCILLMFMMKISEDFSRLWWGYFFIFGFIGLVVERGLFSTWFRKQVSKGRFARKVVLVGETTRAKKLLERLNDPERKNVQVIAIYLPGSKKKEAMGLKVISDIQTLVRFCKRRKVDDVILTYALDGYKGAEKLLAELRYVPCHVRHCLPAALFDKGLTRRVWDAPVVSVYRRPLGERQIFLKRAFDVAGSSVLILLASPALLAIAFFLKFIEKGDVLFCQQRGGFAGEEFEIYKFRSMKVADDGHGEVKQATKNDARITKVGAILRKTSLDELPQLFNVLKGDMSLIGPRPHAVSHDKQYAALLETYAARNRVKPGITGWAQVNGARGETETVDKMAQRVSYDIEYIENWSFWLDMRILFLTALVVFHKNAY